MIDFDYSILQCPITKERLKLLSKEEISSLIGKYGSEFFKIDNISKGFTNESGTYFYPVIEDILLLLPVYALFTGIGEDRRGKMAFDKERVFKYYNEISYNTKNSLKIYEDSPKWVDFREVSNEYISTSFTRAKKHLNSEGKYLLDIASGPIGLKEYIELSENFEYRICVDISVNALIQAKNNYKIGKGIFICADICNIPLRNDICDSVLCQHTLYHIPKNEQKTAVEEMYRVTKPEGNIVIVYSLFYHSWFMNISLFPIQLYRIARHFAGKAYVRLFNSKPRLYFYPHSLRWFKRNFSFSNKINFYCWRSANKYFLNLYIHERLGGRKILNWLKNSEEKHSEFWGKFGEYPIIKIKK
jgi:ubiquinone/menaquinone biosynthesis C-methylase UbiE/uncharacterized protein YbaR (Trm112 family)